MEPAATRRAVRWGRSCTQAPISRSLVTIHPIPMTTKATVTRIARRRLPSTGTDDPSLRTVGTLSAAQRRPYVCVRRKVDWKANLCKHPDAVATTTRKASPTRATERGPSPACYDAKSHSIERSKRDLSSVSSSGWPGGRGRRRSGRTPSSERVGPVRGPRPAGRASGRACPIAGVEQRALTAESQVLVGELEAVGRRGHRVQSSAGLEVVGLRVVDEEAVRGMLATPDAPAELMQLREAEASAFSTSITVAFGTSTPTSITVVEISRCERPLRNSSIRASLSAGRIRPCSRSTVRSGKISRREAFGLGLRGLHLRAVALVDRGAHDERLTSGLDLARTSRRRHGVRRGTHDARLDRLPPRRQLVEDDDVEVAVVGERERPRDRCRRHDEDVRSPPLPFSAVRWCSPNRCCSSTTASERSWKSRPPAPARACRPPGRPRRRRRPRGRAAGPCR